MANSRANIYPIQLQGAELNLNKFDAEIKQYSGFNKNNSPFVGGCLSNIFVKSASMGNGNNIYIDNNGDIFQCNANIFKNNKLVFPNIDGLNRLFFCDELKVDAEYVFNENLLMNLPLSGSRYSFRINSHNCGSLPIDYAGIQEAIEMNLFSYCFGGNFFVFANYTTQNRINVNIFKSTGEFISSFYINTSAFSDFPVIKIVYINSKWLVFYVDTNGNQVVDCYTIGNSGVTESITGISSVKISSYQTTPVELSDIRNYIPVGLYSNKLYFKGDLSSKNSNTILTYVYNSSLISNNSLVITPLENQTVLSNSEIVTFSSKINKNGILSADLQYKKNGINYFYHLNSYKATNYGFRVKKTLSGYTGEYVLGDQNYLYNNMSLLFNNNNLSGISSNQILLTNWNNADLAYLSITSNSIYYKTENKWHKVYYESFNMSKVILRRIGDWLVTNNVRTGNIFNIDYNAYNLKTGDIGLFAPSFNMSQVTTPPAVFDENKDYNDYLFAGAINEYSQEKMSSIILNPVLLTESDFSDNDYYTTKYSFSGNSDYGDFYNVNLYKGFNQAIYFKSSKLINSKLIDLPFPSDTDGNVEYSPSFFSDIKNMFGNKAYIKSGNTFYPLAIGNNNMPVMSFYLAAGIDNISTGFIIQGQFYGIINNDIYAIQYVNNINDNISFIVSVEGLQFCGNSPYEALFYSRTNRCLYSFIGSNVLQQKQLVDKISSINDYIYNPATQTIFLITDIGVIFYSIFGQFLYEKDIEKVFLLNNGVCFALGNTQYEYIKYYLEESNSDYTKLNVKLETCFYGVSNETVSVNDCLYIRLFSEEHEEGEIKISATTLANTGRKTEETTFKITSNDWDKMTHSLYLRYQPKTQRGLGVSFSIDSPFKIASMSVGTQADAILIDKVSKGAINAPAIKSSNVAW